MKILKSYHIRHTIHWCILAKQFVLFCCHVFVIVGFFCSWWLGVCNSTNQTLVHNIQNNTVYQFRVQLSPAHSCHCVNIEAVGDIDLVEGRWQCSKFINGMFSMSVCAIEDMIRTYLSEPVAVLTNSIHHVECHSNSLAVVNTMDTAIAYKGIFGSCPVSQCVFPLYPLSNTNNGNDM